MTELTPANAATVRRVNATATVAEIPQLRAEHLAALDRLYGVLEETEQFIAMRQAALVYLDSIQPKREVCGYPRFTGDDREGPFVWCKLSKGHDGDEHVSDGWRWRKTDEPGGH